MPRLPRDGGGEGDCGPHPSASAHKSHGPSVAPAEVLAAVCWQMFNKWLFGWQEDESLDFFF